jgi:hypothetical protein
MSKGRPKAALLYFVAGLYSDRRLAAGLARAALAARMLTVKKEIASVDNPTIRKRPQDR